MRRAIAISALSAFGAYAIVLLLLVVTQYSFLERFGVGHTVSKLIGLQLGRSAVFASLMVCFVVTGVLHVGTDSPRKLAAFSAAAVPVLQVPLTALALLLAAVFATPLIGFQPGSFFEWLDPHDVLAGELSAVVSGLFPVAVVFGTPTSWSARSLRSKLIMVGLLVFSVGLAASWGLAKARRGSEMIAPALDDR